MGYDRNEIRKKMAEGEAAVITDIQRYSVHDGPGIRTLVFFKGCPLRCQWCHNPETHSPLPELLYKEELCIGCGACLKQCAQGAIKVINGKVVNDKKACILCGKCVETCYAEAREISGKYYTIDEVYDAAMRDLEFYKHTGGGVTLSGGEVLMHAEFASGLLKKLKDSGINTAIETCGYASWENVRKVVQYTDLLLFDIKHSDEDVHKKFTGVSNKLILENLHKISDMGKTIITRVPLIPGVNDSVETLTKIARIAEEVHAKELHILPFHQIGMSKWEAAGKDYKFRDVKEPTTGEVEALVNKVGDIGIPVVIGGN